MSSSSSSISSLESSTPKMEAGMCIQQIDFQHLEDTQKKLSIHMQQIQKYIDLIEEILQIQQDIKRLQIQKKTMYVSNYKFTRPQSSCSLIDFLFQIYNASCSFYTLKI